MNGYVMLDEAALEAKLAEIDAKLAQLTQAQMPDDIKQKLKDVLTWITTNL